MRVANNCVEAGVDFSFRSGPRPIAGLANGIGGRKKVCYLPAYDD